MQTLPASMLELAMGSKYAPIFEYNVLHTDFAGRVEILKTRSRTEIIGLILQAVEAEPLTRSKIMYQSMLNFKQATYYTSLLTDEGLLSYLTQDKKYAITDKGIKFLTLYNETDRLLTTSAHNDEADYLVNDNLQMQKQYGEVTII